MKTVKTILITEILCGGKYSRGNGELVSSCYLTYFIIHILFLYYFIYILLYFSRLILPFPPPPFSLSSFIPIIFNRTRQKERETISIQHLNDDPKRKKLCLQLVKFQFVQKIEYSEFCKGINTKETRIG